MSQIQNPGDDYSEAMDSLQLKLGSLEVTIPPTFQEMKQLRRANMSILKAMEKVEIQSGDARSRYQDSLIEMYEKAGQTLSATAVRKIKRCEALSRVWTDVSIARGANKGGGLSYILTPEDTEDDPATCQQWVKVMDPKEVRAKITQRLQQHFSQSKDCNLTSPPLDITMDFEGTCEKAEAILNGTFDYSQMDQSTQWLLENLQYVAGNNDALEYSQSQVIALRRPTRVLYCLAPMSV